MFFAILLMLLVIITYVALRVQKLYDDEDLDKEIKDIMKNRRERMERIERNMKGKFK